MPALPVRILSAHELRKLGEGLSKRRAIRAIVREHGSVVPPLGDGDVHDSATALVIAILRRRPWRHGNRRAAATGAAVLYRLNCYGVEDGDGLGTLVIAADEGRISRGALCEGLMRVTSSPACAPP